MHYIILPITHSYPAIELKTKIDDMHWVDGRKFSEVIPSLEFEFTVDNEALLPLPDYVSPSAGIPLFSDRLKDLLNKCGIDNIDYHGAVIKNLSSGEVT